MLAFQFLQEWFVRESVFAIQFGCTGAGGFQDACLNGTVAASHFALDIFFESVSTYLAGSSGMKFGDNSIGC